MNVLERFLTYVKYDTMADENSKTCPSSEGQMTLAKYLVAELKSIGLSDAHVDENGYVMATLESNIDKQVPTIGFIAHMDTSDAMIGKNVKPKVITYLNEDIILNQDLNIILSSKDFPELNKYINHELVITDGTTLLGADDKAGIAEIITAIDYLIHNPQIKHGTIKIAFTPDEEIGRGADLFNVKKFNADFAYTLDGSVIGELQYKTFNAASAKININGKSVHPGDSKNKMINAVQIAASIALQFPKDERVNVLCC